MKPHAKATAQDYNTLLETIRDYAIYRLDPNGTIVSWNSGAENIKGYKAEEVIGRNFSLFYTPEDRALDAPRSALEMAAKNGKYSAEGWRLRKDGSKFWANTILYRLQDSAGNLSGFSKVTRDFTQRKAVEEQALREREQHLSSIIRHTVDGLLSLDQQGVITSFNPACERIFGYSAREIIGQPLGTLVPELAAEAEQGFPFDGRIEDNPAQARRREVSGLRKDGETFPLELALSRYEIGGKAMLSALLRDNTEREQAKRDRERLIKRLAESNTELERFAYVASHDMQEPLRAIHSFSDILGAQYADKLDADGKLYLGIIADAAKRMQAMVVDLLDYAKLGNEETPVQPFEASQAYQQALGNLASAILSTGASVSAGPLPRLNGRISQFVRLLQNLIGNGIKYHRPGVAPQIAVTAEAHGLDWRFAVRDNGIGIEPQYYDKIFESFRRLHTRKEYQGSGLGLSVCKKIVGQQGGRVWVESTPGQGSVFYFTWPQHEQ